MKSPRRYRTPQPDRQTGPASPPEIIDLQPQSGRVVGPPVTVLPGSPAPELVVLKPRVLNPVDEVTVLVAPRLPRLWLRVAFAVAPGAEPARVALAAAEFVGRTCAIDKRLRMTVDSGKSAAHAGELVLAFALGRWGALEAKWLEEAKPVVSEVAAGFEGAELRSVEVISE